MFTFTEKDLQKYDNVSPEWGAVGLVTYLRTYSRPRYDELGNIVGRESWKETCKRVIEGNVNLVPSDPTATRDWALRAFDLMYNFAWLPAGRGLWMSGTDYVKRRGGDALVNCWWVDVKPHSYEDMDMFKGTYKYSDPIKPMPSFPFVFTMDRAMVGGGVGFGTGKKNLSQFDEVSNSVDLYIYLDEDHPDWERIRNSEEWGRIKYNTFASVNNNYDPEDIVITDDREGWDVAVRELIDAHWQNKKNIRLGLDLRNIRGYGEPIQGFGGTASGPLPLIDALVYINEVLNQRVGKRLRSVDVLDMMNLIGRCIVSGNVRRTALLALGENDDVDYINAKNYHLVEPIIDRTYGQYGWYTNEWGRKTQKLKPYDEIVKELGKEEADNLIDIFKKQDNHRWASNNSVFTYPMFKDYHFIAIGMQVNGEPGIVNEWLIQNFGRICDGYKEMCDKATGVNPCGEITLEDLEPCNLAEPNPYICLTKGYDIAEAIEIASQYAYRITCVKYMWPQTQRVIERNRRIGVSLTGMTDYFLEKYGHYPVLGFEMDKQNQPDFSRPIFDQDVLSTIDSWYHLVKETNSKQAQGLVTPESNKVTTCKPSGTTAKLSGVGSGIHWHYAAYMIQRIRFHETDQMLPILRFCGYKIEKDMKAPNTMVVEFPVKAPNADHPNFKCAGEVPLEEQFANQYLFAYIWADNAVSATLTFNPTNEGDKIEPLLKVYSDKIKSTSLLPYYGHGLVQAPWEPISKEQYQEMVVNLIPFEDAYAQFGLKEVGDILDSDCSSGGCPIR